MRTERNTAKVLSQFLRAALVDLADRGPRCPCPICETRRNAIASIDQVAEELEAIAAAEGPSAEASDTQRLDWWFMCGLNDSVCEESVDLWWADEEDGDAVERVTHGVSVRDTLDKAMRGEYER